MLDAVPGEPGGVKVLHETSDTALLTWLPPSNPNGVIVQYTVYIRVLEGALQLDTRAVAHYSTSQLQYQLPGLKRRQIYEFWVTASTRVGEGSGTPVVRLIPSGKGVYVMVMYRTIDKISEFKNLCAMKSWIQNSVCGRL
jgi:hypothetical protein